MTLELWHLKVSLVEHRGHTLVRATHLRGSEFWKGKSYRDFDPKNLLQSREAQASALEFTQGLGFEFPLPLGPKTWGKIIALADFPAFEEWEKVHSYYARETYQADLKRWFTHRARARPRTHDALHAGIRKSATRLAAGYGPLGNPIQPQDQAAYARSALLSYAENELKLTAFWGEKQRPPEVEKALQTLSNLVTIYIPEVKVNKKKELAAPDSDHGAPKSVKKSSKKPKHVEGQRLL